MAGEGVPPSNPRTGPTAPGRPVCAPGSLSSQCTADHPASGRRFPMITRSWIPKLFARTPGKVRRAPARFQPQLESLESRYVPSTLLVTTTLDTGVSGDGSLRGELAAAASGDTIEFAGSLKGQTITLSQGELALSRSLTLAGPVTNPVTISGNQASRVFDITSRSAIVTLSGLTITRGYAATLGGGICNDHGTLTVSQSSLSGNKASAGGGMFNDHGTLTVSQSSLSGNSASLGGGGGGGIYNAGTLTVSQSSLSDNKAV